MLTLIAGAMLCVGCSYLGAAVKHIYKIRRDFYKDFLQLLALLKSEISYLKTPLKTIIENFIEGRKGLIVEVLQSYINFLDGGQRTAVGFIKSVYVKKDEMKIITVFLEAIGKNDIKQELALIGATEEKVKQLLSKAEDDYIKLGGMYFKLLVLGGVALMLIVV